MHLDWNPQAIGPYIWELSTAVLFTFIGIVFSRHELGKRERRAVISELISIQRRIYKFATENWKQDGFRELWMIDLLRERVGTLRQMVISKDKLPGKIEQKFSSYESALEKFSTVFQNASRRGDRFWASYDNVCNCSREVMRALSPQYTAEHQEVLDNIANARDHLRVGV